MKEAIQLASMITDDFEHSVTDLAAMIYDMSEGDVGDEDLGDEESIEESLEGPPTVQSDVIARVRSVYENDDIVQRIMPAKTKGEKKIPFDLIQKAHIKLELGDCNVQQGLLYVGQRL